MEKVHAASGTNCGTTEKPLSGLVPAVTLTEKRMPQIQHLENGHGYVVHKLHVVGYKNHYSAWFNASGVLLSAENVRRVGGNTVNVREKTPQWKAVEQAGRIFKQSPANSAQTKPARSLTFEEATARYVNRYTMEFVPAWSQRPLEPGKFYAPSYRTDREWYDNTVFPGESMFCKSGNCHSSGQTWPLGMWLKNRFIKSRGMDQDLTESKS